MKPQWEDEANKLGGRLALRVIKGYANQLWEDLLLALIGQQFQDSDQITGVIIQAKKGGDQINIWLRTGNEGVVSRIKADMTRILSLPDSIALEFDLFFKEEKKPQGGYKNQNYPQDQRKQYPPRQGGGNQGGYQGKRNNYEGDYSGQQRQQ